MTNPQSQTIRQLRPASTSDVLPPVQRYAPACRADSSRRSSPAEAETPAVSESRFSAPMQNHETRNTEHATRVESSGIENSESSIHNPPTSSRASKPKARNGKIARLAKPLRDMVNLMLQNNIPH